MPALKNKRHEAFAQACAKGTSKTEAYRATYGTKAKNPGDIASRLSDKVRNRVKEIQAQGEKITLLTMQRRRELLAERANRKGVTDAALVSLLNLDAKLAGELIEKTDLVTDGQPLPSVMPQIIVAAPPSFATRRQSRN